MKKIVSLMIVLHSLFTFAQEQCGVSNLKSQYRYLYTTSGIGVSNQRISANLTTKRYFPVNFNILRKSDGTMGISSIVAKELIDAVNQAWNVNNFEFYICGNVNYINNDDAYYFEYSPPFVDQNYLTSFNKPDAINVFVGEQGGVCGYASFPWDNSIPGNPISNNFIYVNYTGECKLNSFAHELGHFFGLLHTHHYEDFNFYNPCGLDTRYGPPGFPICPRTTELVNGSNCSSSGDLVCDTPSDPTIVCDGHGDFYFSYSTNNQSCTPTRCSELANYKNDANSQAYNPLFNNLMSYARKECRTSFTQGQLDRVNDIGASRYNLSNGVDLSNIIIDGQNISNNNAGILKLNSTVIKNSSNLSYSICSYATIENSEIQLGSTLEIK